MKKLSGAILSLMVMTQVVQARNNAALFGVAAAAIVGASLIANANKAPRRIYRHRKRHVKKRVVHRKAIVITDEMRIQKSLAYLELYKGKIDGKLNSYTSRTAIKNLNSQYGLGHETRLLPQTWDQLLYLSELFAMDKYLFSDSNKKRSRGRQLQAALKVYGVYDDKIDGIVGSGTRGSIARYKEQQGFGYSTHLSSNERYNLIDSAQKMNADAISEAINNLSPAPRRSPDTRAAQADTTRGESRERGDRSDTTQSHRGTSPQGNQRGDASSQAAGETRASTQESVKKTETPKGDEAQQATPSNSQKDLEEMERALNSIDQE